LSKLDFFSCVCVNGGEFAQRHQIHVPENVKEPEDEAILNEALVIKLPIQADHADREAEREQANEQDEGEVANLPKRLREQIYIEGSLLEQPEPIKQVEHEKEAGCGCKIAKFF
jgi:hypothetical protein